MPLTRAALIVVLVFELKASWTDLMKPLIFIRDIDMFTLTQDSRPSSTTPRSDCRNAGTCWPPAVCW